jgi:AcrR family transcriptional regulator
LTAAPKRATSIFVDVFVENKQERIPPHAMPKIVDAPAKRAEILSAAARTFARHGYRETNLARVADAAGMGKSSLYHYFPTREALFAALVRDLMERETATFDEIISMPRPALERLRQLLDALASLLDGWADAGPLLLDCLRETAGRGALRRTFRKVRGSLAQLIRDGQREGAFAAGDPEALAAAMLACMDGPLLLELFEPGSGRSPAVRELLARAVMALIVPQRGAMPVKGRKGQ